MSEQEFETVYSGTEVRVILLKGLLAEAGVDAMVQNDYQAGITAGFGGGTPNTVRLKIHQDDLAKAKPVIEDFINNQQTDDA
ncbi:putative signal transducing protein [Gilvibacter sediminis]|uniref:putative signal transducing protein n=1 Tax=Gilvibacter sediminis TaxID=379071 RepID=UPI002350BF77|nr:DUF2007 domain-containing protein [Gilvibacter sediminis]MDC7997936.1 DUF2007 domain-containing protein [Gilvibacter sediminis]